MVLAGISRRVAGGRLQVWLLCFKSVSRCNNLWVWKGYVLVPLGETSTSTEINLCAGLRSLRDYKLPVLQTARAERGWPLSAADGSRAILVPDAIFAAGLVHGLAEVSRQGGGGIVDGLELSPDVQRLVAGPGALFQQLSGHATL